MEDYDYCQKNKQVLKFTFLSTWLEFFISCIVLSLECIHKLSIIHRDVKPENLVLDKQGYVFLTDFGIARVFR